MSHSYTFEARYDEPLVRQSSWRYFARQVGGSWPIWGAVVFVSLVHFGIVLRTGDPDFVTAVLAAVWIVFLGLFVVGWLFQRRAALAKLHALDAMRATFTFDDDGLTVASKIATTKMVWAALEEVWIYPRFWIVVMATNAYFTVPIDTAPPEALAFARTKLGKRIK